MKQTTIRMHMNPEESLGTVGHIKSVKESKRGKLKKTVEKKRDDGTIERIEIVQDNGQRLFYIFY